LQNKADDPWLPGFKLRSKVEESQNFWITYKLLSATCHQHIHFVWESIQSLENKRKTAIIFCTHANSLDLIHCLKESYES